MQKSLTKNSIFYLAYEVLNVLFPFLTGMYVARILLPDSIGEVAYVQNIAQYFVILSFLGIPTYGMREVARTRRDKGALNRLYSELMIINAVSTAVFLGGYLFLIITVPDFHDNLTLFVIVGFSIALNFLNNSWLYTGLEEFPYISVRNLIFKTLVFALLVILVRDENDYILYAAITVVGTAGNYIMNMVHAGHFVSLDFHGLDLKRHMKPIFLLVAVNLAIEIYTLVDTTMLGIMCEDKNVAFYTYGSKINKILLQVVNSFTMVLVPRISAHYKDGKMAEFNGLLSKVFRLIFLLSLPMIVGIQFTGNFLVTTIYGNAYINSAYVLRILCFVLLISPIGYLLGSRVLLAAGKESKMVLCVSAGAIANIICNSVLIPLYQEYGAAIASVIGEIVVMTFYIYNGSKVFKLHNVWWSIAKITFSSLIMGLYLFSCTLIKVGDWQQALLQICGAVFVYGIILLLVRETLVLDFLNKIRTKKGRKAS